MLLPLPLLMKKLREHRTPPQASRSARINSAPSLFNSSQVASDSTAYRSGEKKAQRRKTERVLSPYRGLSKDGSAKTMTPPR